MGGLLFKTPLLLSFWKTICNPFWWCQTCRDSSSDPNSAHFLSSQLSSECSHRLGGWMPQNNYPGPSRLSHPRWPAGCIMSVSKLLCIHARGSNRDHRAGGSQPIRGQEMGRWPIRGREKCHQSVSGRLAIIALSLTEIDTNKDKKQSLHLGL